MDAMELTQDLKEKDGLIEDLIHDAYDGVDLGNWEDKKKYNEFLDGIVDMCHQMRMQYGKANSI